MSSTRINKVLANEQVCLWDDLEQDLRYALNGQWSISAEHTAWRLWLIAREIGPTPWENVSLGLLFSGVYQTMVEKMGYPIPEIDIEQFRTEYADNYIGRWERAKKEIMNMELEELDDDN